VGASAACAGANAPIAANKPAATRTPDRTNRRIMDDLT
jgi:hypothetical protein